MLHRRTVVIAAISIIRPAVITSWREDVDLVAAERPELRLEDPAVCRQRGDPVVVAMAKRINFGTGSGLADERIVARHRAVFLQSQRFAVDGIVLLCVLDPTGAADGDVKQAVGSECEP